MNLKGAQRVAGGDLNEAYRVPLAGGGVAFVKRRDGAPPEEYAAEAAGLDWLREPGALQVPEVLDVAPDHLALEWVEPGSRSPAGEEELGRGLAAVHLAGAHAFGAPSGAYPAHTGGQSPLDPLLRIGPLELPDDPLPTWSRFYAERRLAPLAHHAAGRGVIDRLCERIEEFAGPPEPPSRLHGDLWSGNVLWDSGGRPWLIDPAAYGGHREVDLAMLSLFGDPGPRFRAAYEEVAPLADGHEDRVALWQIFPLLVHAALFGGHYGGAAAGAARRYVG